jgi:integrase
LWIELIVSSLSRWLASSACARGEIAALRWEDFDPQWMHIRRAVGLGIVGTPKTASSVASLPLIAPVRVPLELWRVKCAGVTEGWTFPGRFSDQPGDLKARTRVIETTLKTKNIPWKTLYAGRRVPRRSSLNLPATRAGRERTATP